MCGRGKYRVFVQNNGHEAGEQCAGSRAGYVLAEMSVQQTRAHFLRKYGALVDRPEVGARAPRPALVPHMSGRECKSRNELGVMGQCSAHPNHHNLVQQLTSSQACSQLSLTVFCLCLGRWGVTSPRCTGARATPSPSWAWWSA